MDAKEDEEVEAGVYNLLMFRGETGAAVLENAGVEALQQQTSAGREMVTVRATRKALAALVTAEPVQWVERAPIRKPMGDIAGKKDESEACATVASCLGRVGRDCCGYRHRCRF